MKSSARKDDRNLGRLPLQTSEQLKATFRKSEQPIPASTETASAFRTSEPQDAALGNAEQLAAELLDEAFTRAGLENKEIAHLCGVSVSLVEKWRSREARGCPSLV